MIFYNGHWKNPVRGTFGILSCKSKKRFIAVVLRFLACISFIFHPDSAMVAEWVYEQLQIQVAESHRSQVWIPLGTFNMVEKLWLKSNYILLLLTQNIPMVQVVLPAMPSCYGLDLCVRYSESCVQCTKINSNECEFWCK